MSISPDDSTLYIANSGSTVNAVSVADLTVPPASLARPLPSISLPGPGLGVAASQNGVIYVLSAFTEFGPPDPKTGVETFVTVNPVYIYDTTNPPAANNVPSVGQDENTVTHTLIGASPDGTTVLVASSQGLEQYPTNGGQETVIPGLATTAVQLIVSNTNLYFCAPDPAGNGIATPFTTLLFDANDIQAFYGTFSDEAIPGPLAFNFENDKAGIIGDSDVYQLRFAASGPEILVFDTTIFPRSCLCTHTSKWP